MLLLLLRRGPLPLRSGEDAGGGAAGRLSPPRSLGPHGGGGRRASLRGSSALRAERTAASARPPPLPSAFRFSPKPGSPAFRRGGGEGGSQRPPAAR
ncbi:unnamed protein product, partial [Gulo gulo]